MILWFSLRRQAVKICSSALAFLLCLSATGASVSAQRQEKQEQQQPALPAAGSPQVRHIGEAPEAVTLVRVEIPAATADGLPEERTAGGVVIRCDGFVLVPAPLLLARTVDSSSRRVMAAKNPRIEVFSALPPTSRASGTRSDGSGQKSTVYTATPGRFVDPAVPFTLVKINEHHLPCLPLLHPKNVREGQKVRVVFAAAASSGRAATEQGGNSGPADVSVVSHTAILGLQDEGQPDYWTLATKLPGIPAGAVVIDDVSGQALGMITPAGSGVSEEADDNAASGDAPASLRMVSFARLHDITNVIGLRPAASVARDPTTAAAGSTSGEEKEQMVWVPGGPIDMAAVERLNLYDEAMDAKATSACTPGFWIDKAEVTNETYRQFLVSAKHPSLPNGFPTT